MDKKAERQLELAAAKLRSSEAHANHAHAIGVCYDLFRQLLADKPQVQSDRIGRDIYKKDPWMGMDGNKHKGLHMKTSNQNM